MYTVTLLFALIATSLASPNMGPPKPAKTISPTVLTECGCDTPIKYFRECQKIPKSTDSDRAESCLCSRDWYGWSTSCRDCLLLAEGDKSEFYQNFGSVVSGIFVACTNAGGSVSSDGHSVCGNTFKRQACAGFSKDGTQAWASVKDMDSGETKNGTEKVELSKLDDEDDNEEDEEASSTTTTADSKSTASGTVSTTKATATAAAGGNGTKTEANATAPAATSASPSATAPVSMANYGKSAGLSLFLVGVVAAMVM